MTPFPYSIDIEAPIAEARAFMRHKGIRHLPVTESDELAGVISDRDIKLALGPDFDYPSERELKVRDVYVADAYIVDAGRPLAEVATHMADQHIGSAIVTKHGKLVGVFTATDACRALAEILDRQFHRPEGNDAA